MRKLAALALVAAAAACASPPAAPPPVPAPAAAPAPAALPATPPDPGAAPTLTLPEPVRRTLPNGLEVIYVQHGELPLVHATLVAPAGTVVDPAGTPGLASFTADMLDEGAGGMSALQISSALDLLGASLSTRAGWDAADVDLQVLRSRLPEALRIMAAVVTRPDFPAEEVARKKEQRITELTRARDEPASIAGNAFASLVYGAEHPYGRLPATATTRKFDRAALERFHRTYFRPRGSTLILVGDVDADRLHPIVEQAFGGWQGEAPAPVAVPTPAPIDTTVVYVIDKPGAEQSEIRIGHPGVARNNPDYFPLVVLNTLLGGSFTSRLNNNLRETHGYTYGAGSAFAMRRGAGPFVASSAVVTAKTDSALIEFFRELNRIRDEKVSDAELERAKNYVALGIPRRFETVEDVASEIESLELYDLPMSFLNSYVPRVMAVTAADVQRVARQYVRPAHAAVVVVGDLKTIEPGLRALDVAPVEIRKSSEFVK